MPNLKNFKPFSLLLTGTPGWLCDTVLSQLGEALPALTRVRCLIQSGTPDDRIRAWRRANPSATETIAGDLRDEKSLAAACENLCGGVIVHAAAIFHPQKLSDYNAVNRDGTLALASAAKNSGVRRFVFISSTAAQGAAPSKSTLLTEEMPCRPLNAYGDSKLEAERALLRLHEPNVFEVAILRPGPFYGLPVPPHHVALFKDLQRGRVRLVAGGEFARSWSHVPDVAAGVVACLTHPVATGETFNLCDMQPRTQLEICTAAAEALNIKPRFRMRSVLASVWARGYSRLAARFDRYCKSLHLLSEQDCHTGASSHKIQKLLGLALRGDVRDGMRREVAWCRDHALID